MVKYALTSLKSIFLSKSFYLIVTMSSLLFWILMTKCDTDIPTHIQQVVKINSKENTYPSNFGFYITINLLTFISSNLKYLNIVTILVLSCAVFLKFQITLEFLRRYIKKSVNENGLILIAVFLLFCFAIIDPFTILLTGELKMYVGKIVSNVWHNSTIIAVMPFSIALFWMQIRVFENGYFTSIFQTVLMCVLILLNVIIKPAFLIVYIPITFIFLLMNLKTTNLLTKNTVLLFSPLLLATFLILGQSYLIYYLGLGSISNESSAVSFSYPFEIMGLSLPKWYIPISLFFSLLFPLISILFYKEILNFIPFKYAIYLTLFGFLFGAFFKETGPRMLHGNLMWQNIICCYLLFMTSVAFLMKKTENFKTMTRKNKILWSVFLMHCFSGIIYIVKFIFVGNGA